MVIIPTYRNETGSPTRVVIFLCLILFSLFIHLAVFFAYENIRLRTASKKREEQSVLVELSPTEETSELPDVTDTSEVPDFGRKAQEEPPGTTKYELGALGKDKNEQQTEKLGAVLRKGLPDLSFDYGDGWYEITQRYFKELDIIFHPDRTTFFVIKWHNANPVVQRVTGRTVADYIASLSTMFVDKAKNRKEEFGAYPPLRQIYEEIQREHFRDHYEPDIQYVGVMPHEEISLIVEQIENLAIRSNEVISHLLVSYQQNDDGSITVNVGRVQ